MRVRLHFREVSSRRAQWPAFYEIFSDRRRAARLRRRGDIENGDYASRHVGFEAVAASPRVIGSDEVFNPRGPCARAMRINGALTTRPEDGFIPWPGRVSRMLGPSFCPRAHECAEIDSLLAMRNAPGAEARPCADARLATRPSLR